jgi:hypothetical protein
MADLKRPLAVEMCPPGQHVVRAHKRVCASGTVAWVDAHIRKNPIKMQAGYLQENLLYLYWHAKEKYPPLFDIPGFKGENEYDQAIQFWLYYWKEQGLPFPSDLDPLMIKAMIAIESGFNPNVQNKKSSATGLLQLLDSAVRTLWGLPDKTGWVEVKKAKIHIAYQDKKDPIVNIAVAIRFLSYKFSLNKKGFSRDAEGTIAGYNQFNDEGRKYAKKVLSLYKEALKQGKKDARQR